MLKIEIHFKRQIGWDWFSLQFDDGSALMLFQLRESGGGTSDSSSGTFSPLTV